MSAMRAVSAIVILFAATPSSAQIPNDSILEERTRALSAELRCPVCQGLSIQDSPSELAVQMKGVVRDQLRAGKSEAEIKSYFISKYGEWVLLQPKAEGMNLLVYLLPLLMLLGGATFIVVMVKRWSRTAPPA